MKKRIPHGRVVVGGRRYDWRQTGTSHVEDKLPGGTWVWDIRIATIYDEKGRFVARTELVADDPAKVWLKSITQAIRKASR